MKHKKEKPIVKTLLDLAIEKSNPDLSELFCRGWDLDLFSTFLSRKNSQHLLYGKLRLVKPKPKTTNITFFNVCV